MLQAWTARLNMACFAEFCCAWHGVQEEEAGVNAESCAVCTPALYIVLCPTQAKWGLADQYSRYSLATQGTVWQSKSCRGRCSSFCSWHSLKKHVCQVQHTVPEAGCST